MRTQNSIKNTIIGILGQVFSVILSFVSRTIFILILGANYLGINGLFSNILSMLSLAELGIGSAIIYHMYKPLAEKNEEQLKSLMYLYAKAYKMIGIIVAILGISLIPFMDYIIKDEPNVQHLTLIYILFLANSVVSYFFSYKISIINADQKGYIITLKQQKYLVIQTIVQIIILLLDKNYILYLCIQIIFTFVFNLSVSRKADLMYPFLKSRDIKPLSKENKKIIFKHVAAMMSHKVGGVVVNGTDNILISSFVGVYWVGLYSNYIMIISMLNRFINQIFDSITASIGNLNVEGDVEKSYSVYKKILFVNFWIYGFSSICLLVLFNPFIELWIGSKFIMSSSIVLVIIINFYISGMRQTTIVYNATLGLFWNDRYKPWIEAIINVVVSILLLKQMGIVGVFLGTFTSTVCTSLWVDPYILFKHGFKKNLSRYFSMYLKYLLITVLGALVTRSISLILSNNNWYTFILKIIVCVLVPNMIFIICSFKTKEFKDIKQLIISNFRRRLPNIISGQDK